ncbi:MAG: CPBP family intramembrane glutamic endopeptidase [Sphingomonas sp.]
MLDILLLICLLLIVPGWQVWRSRTEAGRPPESRSTRYRRAILGALALAALLAADWVVARRPVAALGLDWPIARAGLIGLAIAITLLIAVAATSPGDRRPVDPERAAKAKQAAAMLLPETPGELRLFLLFLALVGVIWELLYRGYLLWALTPTLGTIGAVIIAALAYGLAHGFKSASQFAASLASALAFTIGYALTHSLWWLIALHIGLPLLGLSLARRRLLNTPASSA